MFSLKSGGNSEIYKKWEVGVKIWRVTPKSGDLASLHTKLKGIIKLNNPNKFTCFVKIQPIIINDQ